MDNADPNLRHCEQTLSDILSTRRPILGSIRCCGPPHRAKRAAFLGRERGRRLLRPSRGKAALLAGADRPAARLGSGRGRSCGGPRLWQRLGSQRCQRETAAAGQVWLSARRVLDGLLAQYSGRQVPLRSDASFGQADGFRLSPRTGPTPLLSSSQSREARWILQPFAQ